MQAHLSLIAHRYLDENHGEVFPIFDIFFDQFEDRFDPLEADPEAAKAENEAVSTLNQEEDDTGIGEEL